MLVPGGTARGGGSRVAGGLLACASVLTVVATFFPIHRFNSSGSTGLPKYQTTIGVWASRSGVVGKETPSPAWTAGVWLVLIALVGLTAAVALFATARRPVSRARTFAVLGAGIVAAAAAAQCLPAVSGLVLAPSVIEYHLEAGWILLMLAAVSAVAGGLVASTASAPRAMPVPGPWPPAPPARWGGPPQAWPAPPQWPPTGPFPAPNPPPSPPRG